MDVRFKIYRYNPEVDKKPYYDEYTVTVENEGVKVLTALELVKEQDPAFWLCVGRAARVCVALME